MKQSTFRECIKRIASESSTVDVTFPWQVSRERVDALIDAARVRGTAVYQAGIATNGRSVSFHVDEGAMASKFLARLQRVAGFAEAYISGRVSLADALLLLGKGVEMAMDDGYTSITFADPLTPRRLARLDALIGRYNTLEGLAARLLASRVDPETASIPRGSCDLDRTIWLEGVFGASAAALLEAMNTVSAVTEIRTGFTFKLDGICYEYEHVIVDLEDPICPRCGRTLEVLAIDSGPRPVWGRGACVRCKKCYPLVEVLLARSMRPKE